MKLFQFLLVSFKFLLSSHNFQSYHFVLRDYTYNRLYIYIAQKLKVWDVFFHIEYIAFIFHTNNILHTHNIHTFSTLDMFQKSSLNVTKDDLNKDIFTNYRVFTKTVYTFQNAL